MALARMPQQRFEALFTNANKQTANSPWRSSERVSKREGRQQTAGEQQIADAKQLPLFSGKHCELLINRTRCVASWQQIDAKLAALHRRRQGYIKQVQLIENWASA